MLRRGQEDRRKIRECGVLKAIRRKCFKEGAPSSSVVDRLNEETTGNQPLEFSKMAWRDGAKSLMAVNSRGNWRMGIGVSWYRQLLMEFC